MLTENQTPPHRDPDDACDDRALKRRLNNFLTVCMTHAEAALQSDDPEELAAALRWILGSARSMAPRSGIASPDLQRSLPFEGTVSNGGRGRGAA